MELLHVGASPSRKQSNIPICDNNTYVYVVLSGVMQYLNENY